MTLSPYASCKLSEQQVRYVLTTKKPQRELARELNISDTAIQRIRAGLAYTHMLPDVPRPAAKQGPTCEDCVHLSHGACSLDFPEARRRNYTIAGSCSAFTTHSLR